MAKDTEQDLPLNPATAKEDNPNHTKILADHTMKDFPFYYLRISLVILQRSSNQFVLDELTVKKHLTAAMTQRFGVLGSSVPTDILKIEGDNAWIRVPFEDRLMATEALSGWTGNGISWRIRESSCWLGGITGSDGRDLFDD